MVNTYYFDLGSNIPFSILDNSYYFNDIQGSINPITNLLGYNKYSIDYTFKKTIVLKSIRFKLLGLEGCRLYGYSDLRVNLLQSVKPLLGPNPSYPRYFDYTTNKWITDADIDNGSPDIQNQYLLNVKIVEMDIIYPLNTIITLNTIENKLLYSYGLTLSSGVSSLGYNPILYIDTTNADASYNGRPITLRAYLEVEE